MKIKELIDKGLLKAQPVDENEINGSILMAEHFLERSKGNMEMNFYDVAFLLAYSSMFHSTRALLFKAGYKERGHFALIAAMEELYKDDAELTDALNVLDRYRLTRHAIQYSGALSTELDAIQAIKDAERTLALAKQKKDTH